MNPVSSDFLIVALDLPTAAEARAMVDRLGPAVGFYKVGMELFFSAGMDFVHYLQKNQKKVFLDLKLNDIPATLEKATRVLSAQRVDYLTLFTGASGVEAARRGLVPAAVTRLLNVTVLTSEAENSEVATVVSQRAALTLSAGGHGVICSGQETAALRGQLGQELVIINPGIRPAASALDDQKRVVTPRQAWQAGASHIVVGRPVVQAADPLLAVQQIFAELSGL